MADDKNDNKSVSVSSVPDLKVIPGSHQVIDLSTGVSYPDLWVVQTQKYGTAAPIIQSGAVGSSFAGTVEGMPKIAEKASIEEIKQMQPASVQKSPAQLQSEIEGRVDVELQKGPDYYKLPFSGKREEAERMAEEYLQQRGGGAFRVTSRTLDVAPKRLSESTPSKYTGEAAKNYYKVDAPLIQSVEIAPGKSSLFGGFEKNKATEKAAAYVDKELSAYGSKGFTVDSTGKYLVALNPQAVEMFQNYMRNARFSVSEISTPEGQGYIAREPSKPMVETVGPTLSPEERFMREGRVERGPVASFYALPTSRESGMALARQFAGGREYFPFQNEIIGGVITSRARLSPKVQELAEKEQGTGLQGEITDVWLDQQLKSAAAGAFGAGAVDVAKRITSAIPQNQKEYDDLRKVKIEFIERVTDPAFKSAMAIEKGYGSFDLSYIMDYSVKPASNQEILSKLRNPKMIVLSEQIDQVLKTGNSSELSALMDYAKENKLYALEEQAGVRYRQAKIEEKSEPFTSPASFIFGPEKELPSNADLFKRTMSTTMLPIRTAVNIGVGIPGFLASRTLSGSQLNIDLAGNSGFYAREEAKRVFAEQLPSRSFETGVWLVGGLLGKSMLKSTAGLKPVDYGKAVLGLSAFFTGAEAGYNLLTGVPPKETATRAYSTFFGSALVLPAFSLLTPSSGIRTTKKGPSVPIGRGPRSGLYGGPEGVEFESTFRKPSEPQMRYLTETGQITPKEYIKYSISEGYEPLPNEVPKGPARLGDLFTTKLFEPTPIPSEEGYRYFRARGAEEASDVGLTALRGDLYKAFGGKASVGEPVPLETPEILPGEFRQPPELKVRSQQLGDFTKGTAELYVGDKKVSQVGFTFSPSENRLNLERWEAFEKGRGYGAEVINRLYREKYPNVETMSANALRSPESRKVFPRTMNNLGFSPEGGSKYSFTRNMQRNGKGRLYSFPGQFVTAIPEYANLAGYTFGRARLPSVRPRKALPVSTLNIPVGEFVPRPEITYKEPVVEIPIGEYGFRPERKYGEEKPELPIGNVFVPEITYGKKSPYEVINKDVYEGEFGRKNPLAYPGLYDERYKNMYKRIYEDRTRYERGRGYVRENITPFENEFVSSHEYKFGSEFNYERPSKYSYEYRYEGPKYNFSYLSIGVPGIGGLGGGGGGGGGGAGGRGGGRRTMTEKEYRPSFTAAVLGIRGTPTVASGLGIRPLPGDSTKAYGSLHDQRKRQAPYRYSNINKPNRKGNVLAMRTGTAGLFQRSLPKAKKQKQIRGYSQPASFLLGKSFKPTKKKDKFGGLF